MARWHRRLVAATATGALAVTLAACGGGSTDGKATGSGTSAASAGGTLTYLIYKPYEHVDPQRTYLGVEISNFTRTVYRQLVAFPTSTDQTVGTTPVPDLATDTGTSSNGGKVWKFTIKDGVKWQDGKAITCADFQYGASRVFASDVITGGPNYLLSYLDIPTDPKTGLSVYDGPYKGDNQADFDKAITCDGNTITYNFNKPWPDFPLAVASLHMMDPYRKDKDQGDKSNYQIFSNGPYEIKGGTAWSKESGATFVRNPNYDKSTDSTKIREANPDSIVFKVGQTTETIYDQLIADGSAAQTSITSQSVPPAYYSQISGSVADRAVNVKSPYVDYLVPNFAKLSNPSVREALKTATNATAWINAGGGTKAYSTADSIVNPLVTGYQANSAFSGSKSGDVAAAKALLQKAGVTLPYPITFTYPTSDTMDKQAAALKATWDAAGFKTTLDGLGDTYYDVVDKLNKESSVVWAGWGADWPSAITVTAPLFDSRPNISGANLGQDYGDYKSNEFNNLVTQAQNASDVTTQTKALQQADEVLGKDVAYIPLEVQLFYYVWGSKVRGFSTTPASSSYPDLGTIGVTS